MTYKIIIEKVTNGYTIRLDNRLNIYKVFRTIKEVIECVREIFDDE